MHDFPSLVHPLEPSLLEPRKYLFETGSMDVSPDDDDDKDLVDIIHCDECGERIPEFSGLS